MKIEKLNEENFPPRDIVSKKSATQHIGKPLPEDNEPNPKHAFTDNHIIGLGSNSTPLGGWGCGEEAVFCATEENDDSLIFHNSMFREPQPSHVVHLSACDGSVFFTHHGLNFKFNTLNTTSHTIDTTECKNLHKIHEVKQCPQCSPILNSLFAVKEIEELQFGVKDWSEDDHCCGWACDFALDTCTFWHFTSPQHVSRKYDINPNIIHAIMGWINSLTPNCAEVEDLDYHSKPFGRVFLTPEEHFTMLIEYLKTMNLLPTLSPATGVNQKSPPDFKKGSGGDFCEHSTTWGTLLCSESLQCLQTKSGYQSLGKLMISPRFVSLVFQLFPEATIEDVFLMRETYLQTTTPTRN